MDRRSDRLPRQTRCEGMRIEREIQMGASGGEQSIKASGHWPREQAGHKPATNMTVHAKSALDPRRASTQSPSSSEFRANRVEQATGTAARVAMYGLEGNHGAWRQPEGPAGLNQEGPNEGSPGEGRVLKFQPLSGSDHGVSN